MVAWVKEDLAAGKVSQAQADAMFAELNTPIEHRGPDTRSAEQVALDQSFPGARPEEYVIQYDKPGQERPMDPMQKQNLKQFDQTARTWLSQAGFTLDHGSSLATAIGRVLETTQKMTEGQETEYTKLEGAYGKDLEAKLRSAARMIHELEAKQPGVKQLLRSRAVGDAAPVVALLVQQAERYHMRNRQ